MNLWMQRGLVLATAAVLLSLLIPVIVYRKTAYKPTLNDAERTIINFTPSSLDIPHKGWQQATLKQPLTTGAATASVTNTGTAQLQAHLPPAAPALPPSLSFIMHDGRKSTAIIGGNMVKTGDTVQGWQVEQIERNRVLLRNPKGTVWLKLD